MAALNCRLRRRGSRQVLVRRAGPGPRRHGVREAAAGARRQDLRHRHRQASGRKAVAEIRRRGRAAWTRSTTCRVRRLLARARWARTRQRADPARACKAKIICGAANNQLADDAIGDEVEKRGILYAPDYAVNAGGVMNVSREIDGYNRERAMRMMRTIYHNLARIYEIAERDGIPTYKAADRLAESASRKCARRARSIGTDGCANCASLDPVLSAVGRRPHVPEPDPRPSRLSARRGDAAPDVVSSRCDAGADRRRGGTAALPALLAALQGNAATPGGSRRCCRALDRDHDGSILDDLAGFLGQGPSPAGQPQPRPHLRRAPGAGDRCGVAAQRARLGSGDEACWRCWRPSCSAR